MAPLRRVVDRERLAALRRRSQQVLVLAGVTGIVTGLLVAGFEWLIAEVVLAAVLDAPVAVRAAAPAAGLVLAAAALRWLGGGAGPATSDEYIRNFHTPSRRLDLRPVPARLAAAVATLGSGGAPGYEGPALYTGAAVGSSCTAGSAAASRPRRPRSCWWRGRPPASPPSSRPPSPAWCSPSRSPTRRTWPGACCCRPPSAPASYVTFAAFAGTEPLLPVAGQPPFNLVDLGGAAALGLAAGILARLFVTVIPAAKGVAARGRPVARAVAAGACLAALLLAGRALTGEDVTLGPGYDALPDATVEELFWQHVVGTRQRTVPVVDGTRYLGMASADGLEALDRGSWPATAVDRVMRTDVPAARPDWQVGDALRAMEQADVDRLAVLDDDRFLGVVTASEVVRLDEILERAWPEAR
jgi:CIC family chloride channel protein